MRQAHKAVIGFGDKDAEGLIRDYGNDPRFVRLMNRVGAEMGEDRSMNPGHAAGRPERRKPDVFRGLQQPETPRTRQGFGAGKRSFQGSKSRFTKLLPKPSRI
jgi:hypothetical protein